MVILVAGVCLFFLAVDWIVEDRARFSMGTLFKALTMICIALGFAMYMVTKMISPAN